MFIPEVKLKNETKNSGSKMKLFSLLMKCKEGCVGYGFELPGSATYALNSSIHCCHKIASIPTTQLYLFIIQSCEHSHFLLQNILGIEFASG